MRISDLRFLLALILPAFSALGLVFAPQNAFYSTLMVWLSFAIMETLLPKNSPAPAAEPDAKAYFQWVLRLYVMLQMGLIMLGAFAAAQADWLVVLGVAFAVGYVTGAQGITFAHELGHSKSKADRFGGWALMTSVCYGHFMVEHYRGHHPRAATFDDPASARYGESFYSFLPRTLLGGLSSGWRLEAARLKQMKSAWRSSPLLWSTLGSVGLLVLPFLMIYMPFMHLAGVLTAQAAIKIIGFFAVQSIVAVVLLELVNYIEHYGLQRQVDGSKREAFGKMHAWNADHVITNSLLVNLQRHSDHHMHAWKPYATLKDTPDSPRLPTGYAGSILLAAIPPLWFALMHPRLAALEVNSSAQSKRV